jgi:hypothetical protein
MLKFNTKNIVNINNETITKKYQSRVDKICKKIQNGNLPGQEMMG